MAKYELYHTLNYRARRKDVERDDRELAKLKELDCDPRRDHSGDDMSRAYPLIEDEE